MPATEMVCVQCRETLHENPNYCPECGAEDPLTERALYDFERDVDLPVVIEVSHYNYNYKLWHMFCEEVFGERAHPSDVVNMPEEGFAHKNMKHLVFEVYYTVTEDHEIKGPYLDRRDARDDL